MPRRTANMASGEIERTAAWTAARATSCGKEAVSTLCHVRLVRLELGGRRNVYSPAPRRTPTPPGAVQNTTSNSGSIQAAQ